MAAAAGAEGRGAPHGTLQRLGRALARAGAARSRGRLREPGHSRPHHRGDAGARSGLEEVRALLDVEPARRGGRGASGAVRALCPDRAQPATVTTALGTALVV